MRGHYGQLYITGAFYGHTIFANVFANFHTCIPFDSKGLVSN